MPRSSHRPMTRRGLFSVAAVAGLVAVTGCSSKDNSDLSDQANSADGKGFISGDGSVTEFSKAQRGKPVDFEGKLFGGESLTGAQLRGKPSLLNFWYAGCAPCRAEAPHLQKLFTEFGEKANFYGINLRDEQGTAEAFERTFGIGYRSVEDRSGGVLMALSQYVPAQAVPTTLVLDSEGRVAARILGQIDESVVRTLVQDQIDGKDATNPSKGS